MLPRALFIAVLVLATGSPTYPSGGAIHVLDPADGLEGGAGYAVTAIGDVDLDGVPDLIVGAPGAIPPGATTQTGGVFVVSGADESLVASMYGTSASSFGWSIDAVGDFDQDGIPDFVVGAPGSASSSAPGRASVRSGQDGSLLLQLTGAMAGDVFGTSVAGIGDADLDGFVDVLVGAPLDGFEGKATVFSGAGGGILYVYDAPYHMRLGESVSGVGDVDLDGHDDFLVGMPSDKVNGLSSGSAFVGSGKDGSLLALLHGGEVSAHLGRRVGEAGDADGDGVPDYAVVSEGAFNSISSHATIHSGATHAVLHQFGDAQERVDRTASFGDFDGDGRGDLLVRYRGVPGSVDQNAVRLRSGADGAVLEQWFGSFAAHFGHALAGPGDVNGDGRLDVAIGEWSKNRTYVLSPHCGAIAQVGQGCAPSGWAVPTLELVGCATPGADLVLKGFRGSFGAPPGFLFAGPSGASIAVGGCTFLVGGPLVVAPLPAGSLGSFVQPVEVPIPFGPGSVRLQMLVPAAQAPAGFAASPAVAVTFD